MGMIYLMRVYCDSSMNMQDRSAFLNPLTLVMGSGQNNDNGIRMACFCNLLAIKADQRLSFDSSFILLDKCSKLPMNSAMAKKENPDFRALFLKNQ